MPRESDLYGSVKSCLEELLGTDFPKDQLSEPRFAVQVCSHKITDSVKKALDSESLYMITLERFFPDIVVVLRESVGSESKKLMVVEVKRKVKIKDIYQTKQYAQIFSAKYSLLICTKLPEVIKRFLERRPEILYVGGSRNVVIARFDETSKKIVEYYPLRLTQSVPWLVELDMQGPYPLTIKEINKLSKRPGVCALGSSPESQDHFTIDRFCREDYDLRHSLRKYVDSYDQFFFTHTRSAKEAFEKLCRYHHHFATDQVHPAHKHSDWKCPICGSKGKDVDTSFSGKAEIRSASLPT